MKSLLPYALYQDFQKIEDFKMNIINCNPFSFDRVIVQLHHFAETSEPGYWTVLLTTGECRRRKPLLFHYEKISCCTNQKDNYSKTGVDSSYVYSSGQSQQDVYDWARHDHGSRRILDRQYGSIMLNSEQHGNISYFRS